MGNLWALMFFLFFLINDYLLGLIGLLIILVIGD
jgi:hypothetical protein